MTLRFQAVTTGVLFAALLLVAHGCGATAPPPQGDTATVEANGTPSPGGTTETIGGTATLEEGFEVVATEVVLTRAEERGLMIFRHYCAHCHGETGAGDGQNAFGLVVAPRILRGVEMDDRSDGELHRVITDGGAAHGFANLMPPWGQVLDSHRIEDLVGLIRVLPDLEGPEDNYGDVPSLDDESDGMGDFSL